MRSTSCCNASTVGGRFGASASILSSAQSADLEISRFITSQAEPNWVLMGVVMGEPGRITMGKAIKLTRAGRDTRKQHFRVLVDRGTFDQHGAGRGVCYDPR
jgi:hypothetical protein